MIEEAQKFDIKSLQGGKCSIFAVPKKIEESGGIRYELDAIEIKINDEKAVIALGDIRSIIFALSNPKQQRDMLPLQMVTQRNYKTLLGLKAERDIKKGEMINFQVDIPLPPIEKEIAQEAARQLRTGQMKPADILKI